MAIRGKAGGVVVTIHLSTKKLSTIDHFKGISLAGVLY